MTTKVRLARKCPVFAAAARALVIPPPSQADAFSGYRALHQAKSDTAQRHVPRDQGDAPRGGPEAMRTTALRHAEPCCRNVGVGLDRGMAMVVRRLTGAMKASSFNMREGLSVAGQAGLYL